MGASCRKTLASRLRNATLAIAIVTGAAAIAVSLPQQAMAAISTTQTALTATQAQAVSNALAQAVAGVNAQTFANDAAKQTALAQAVASVATQMVGTYGGSAAGAITSIIIAQASTLGIPDATAGQGLGQAAAQLNAADSGAANAIASTVANEGTSLIVANFRTSVVGSGGPQSLADAAGGAPNATGSTNGGAITNNVNLNNVAGGSGGGGGGAPPCANPSCT